MKQVTVYSTVINIKRVNNAASFSLKKKNIYIDIIWIILAFLTIKKLHDEVWKEKKFQKEREIAYFYSLTAYRSIFGKS